MAKNYSFRSLMAAWRGLLSAALVGMVLALIFSLLTPLQYSSTVRILITQSNATGLDPYTALKSTERIASSLSELVYTTTFFNNIIAQAQDFDASYFPTDEINKRKAWRKTLGIYVDPSTGIMTVSAFNPVREQARILVAATAKEIAVQAPNYFGSFVRVQVIDTPLDSRWFVRPNFFGNAAMGFFVGFLMGLIWTLARIARPRATRE